MLMKKQLFLFLMSLLPIVAGAETVEKVVKGSRIFLHLFKKENMNKDWKEAQSAWF
jgi:hypothetical protein